MGMLAPTGTFWSWKVPSGALIALTRGEPETPFAH